MSAKLVDKDYIINPDGKRAKDSRVPVTVIHDGNVNILEKYQIYHKLNGDLSTKLAAISFNYIPKRVHQAFESIRDNGMVPVKTKIFILSKKNEVGGIPIKGRSPEECFVDILLIAENKKKQNLRSKGDGLNEKIQNYVPNTVLYENIREADLVTIQSKVDVEKTNEHLCDLQTNYGTCKNVITTFPMWKEIKDLFSAKAYYLFTSNFLWMFTQKDSNQYVKDHKDDDDYVYNHCWDAEVNLPREKIDKILRSNKSIDFVPLFKMVHFEWDTSGELNIFFQKCSAHGSYSMETDWSWVYFKITEKMMCIACLGWVSIDGIAPVMPKRDPPATQGYYNNELSNGGTPAAQSGHRYTEARQHCNCPDRLVEDDPGSDEYVYPGNKNLTSESIAKMDSWTEMTKRLQALGAKYISSGLDISSAFDSVELLTKNLELDSEEV